MRENLPADLWRVCGHIHPAVGVFCLIYIFFKLVFQRIFSSGAVGAAEAAARGGGSKERLLPQQRPRARSGSGQVLRHRGSRQHIPVPRATGPCWCHPRVRTACGRRRGSGCL